MAQTFLTGLAQGLGGESLTSMVNLQKSRRQSNASDLIQRMQTEELITEDFDGAKINWEKFKRPEYKGLRQQLINSGGQALLKYFEKDGSIRQGSFDDMVEIRKGEFAVGTKREDGKTPGQLTAESGSGEDETVVITPERHLERIGNVILGGVFQDYDPGYGAGLALQRKRMDKIERERQRRLSKDPDLKASQTRLDLINGRIAELQEALKTAVDTGVDETQNPLDTRDAVVTINEELDVLEDEKRVIEGDLGDLEVPYGIPARGLGEKVDPELYELPESWINSSRKKGLPEEVIQKQVNRHNNLLERVQNAEFKGFFAAGSDRAEITIASQDIATQEGNLHRLQNSPKAKIAEGLRQRLDNGEELTRTDLSKLNAYDRQVKAINDKLAKHQKTITDTFHKQAEGDYFKPGEAWNKVKTFFGDWAKLNNQERKLKDIENGKIASKISGLHTHKVNEIVKDQMAQEALDPREVELNNLLTAKIIEEYNWKTLRDAINDDAFEMKDSILHINMAIRATQARGGTHTDAFNMLELMENASVSGFYQIGPKELAAAEEERLKRAAAVKEAKDTFAKEQLQMSDRIGEDMGELITSIVDKESSQIKPPTTPEFRNISKQILNEYQTVKQILADGGSELTGTWDNPSPYVNSSEEAVKEVIAYGIAAGLEESLPKFWDILPTGRPGVSEWGRWWAAQDFFAGARPRNWVGQQPTSINAAQLGGMVDRMYAKFDSNGNLMSIWIKPTAASSGDEALRVTRGHAQKVFGDNFPQVENYFRDKERKNAKKQQGQ